MTTTLLRWPAECRLVQLFSSAVLMFASLSAGADAWAQDAPQPAPDSPPPAIDADPAPPTSAPADSLTLARVLEVAIRQKPSLEQAAIDVAIAEAAMLEVVGLDDWRFDATIGWSSARLQAFGLDQDAFSLEGNLSRRLSTGGTVSLHAETGYTRATTEGVTRETYAHTISASMAQPLLRGRGKRIAHAARRRSAMAREAAVLAHRMEAIVTVRQVISAYWELAYAWRDLEIRKNSLALARERLRNTQAAIDAGAVAPTEALAVEQGIVAREEAIISAEQALARLSLDLRRSAGLEISPTDIDLVVSAPATIAEREFDIRALVERALDASPTLARLRVLEKDAQIDVELAENGLLPELDLLVSVGPTGSADDPSTAAQRMIEFDDLTVSANLTYRQSIGKRQAKGASARAHARLHSQRVGTEDVKAQVIAALVLEVKRARAAKQRFDLGERAIELSRKNVQAEKDRFELGRATNFDVMQRQDELEQAQLRQARALIDFLDAVAAIDALTGDILDRYGITLEPVSGRSGV